MVRSRSRSRGLGWWGRDPITVLYSLGHRFWKSRSWKGSSPFWISRCLSCLGVSDLRLLSETVRSRLHHCYQVMLIMGVCGALARASDSWSKGCGFEFEPQLGHLTTKPKSKYLFVQKRSNISILFQTRCKSLQRLTIGQFGILRAYLLVMLPSSFRRIL